MAGAVRAGDRPRPPERPKPAASQLDSRAFPAPDPGVHFCTHKSEPKKRQNQGFGILCPIGRHRTLPLRCHRRGKILRGSDLYRVSGRTSAVGPFEGVDVSLFLERTACFCRKATVLRQKELQNLSARGPSGEVGKAPRQLRGGQRPEGHSAAAGPQINPQTD